MGWPLFHRLTLFLLPGQAGIFHPFADAKFQRCLRWNLDGFACCWVASFALFTLCENDFSEARQNELAVLLHFLTSESRKLCEDLFCLCPLKTELLGKMIDDFCLAHALAVRLACCHLEVTASRGFIEVKLSGYHITEYCGAPPLTMSI